MLFVQLGERKRKVMYVIQVVKIPHGMILLFLELKTYR